MLAIARRIYIITLISIMISHGFVSPPGQGGFFNLDIDTAVNTTYSEKVPIMQTACWKCLILQVPTTFTHTILKRIFSKEMFKQVVST